MKNKKPEDSGSRFSKFHLLVFAAIFSLLGGFYVLHSFANAFPSPSNLRLVSKTSNSISIAWTAPDLQPSQQPYFKDYLVYRNSSPIATTTSTSYTNSGLSPSTTYGYSVAAEYAGGGQTGLSDPTATLNVTTNANPPSPSPPSLTFTANPTSVVYGGLSTLKWTSSNTNSCAASGSWNGSKGVAGNVTTGQLIGPKTYSYTLNCNGAGGSVSKTVKVSVGARGTTTPPPPPPNPSPSTPPPQPSTLGISNLAVTNITINSAKIVWQSSKEATSEVLYGPDNKYGQKLTDVTLTKDHQFTLQPLEPGHRYHFIVKNIDSDGKTTQSEDQTFSTKGATLLITVVNQSNDRVKDAKVTFLSATKTTDEKGQVTFNDVPLAKLKGTVVYNNQTYNVSASIISADSHDQPQVAIFRIKTPGGSGWIVWIIGAVVVAVLSFIYLKFLRGRGGLRRHKADDYPEPPSNVNSEGGIPSFGSGPLFPPGWKPSEHSNEQEERKGSKE